MSDDYKTKQKYHFNKISEFYCKEISSFRLEHSADIYNLHVHVNISNMVINLEARHEQSSWTFYKMLYTVSIVREIYLTAAPRLRQTRASQN